MGAVQQMLLAEAASGAGVTYATWNPSDKSANVTLSGGNLSTTNSTSGAGVRATIGKASGKWYWEVTRTGGVEANIGIGTSSASISTFCGGDNNAVGYDSSDGKVYKNGTVIVTGTGGMGVGDILGIALDMDGGTVKFYRNNTLYATATHGLTGTVYPMIGDFASGCSETTNFGASTLTYTPPAGYNSGMYN